jgi:hypothetical protein
MRSSAGGSLASTISRDRGRAWTSPNRITESNEHPGDLLRLRNGDLLLSFGQRNKPYGVQAMLSHDDGATWDRGRRFLLAWDGDHGDLGYPVSVERPDERLVTVYYIVYGERDPEGIKGIAPKNAFTKAIIWSLNMPAHPSLNWSEKHLLPRGVSGAAAASLGGEIVFAGGTTWEEGAKLTLADLQIYSPAADSWRFGPPAPNKIAYAPFLHSGDGLEIFGGADGAGATRAIWKLNPSKTSWTRVGETPIDTILGQVALLGNRTLLFGGCPDVADLTRCSSDIWQRTSNREWTKAGSLPIPGLALAAASVAGGTVYLFGGCTMPAPGDLRNRAEVHVYDPDRGAWKRLRDLPRANRGLTAHALNDRTILLFGGYTATPQEAAGKPPDFGFTSQVWAYDIASDTYGSAAPMPLAASGVEFLRLGNSLYGAGGEDRMRHRSARIFASPVD